MVAARRERLAHVTLTTTERQYLRGRRVSPGAHGRRRLCARSESLRGRGEGTDALATRRRSENHRRSSRSIVPVTGEGSRAPALRAAPRPLSRGPVLPWSSPFEDDGGRTGVFSPTFVMLLSSPGPEFGPLSFRCGPRMSCCSPRPALCLSFILSQPPCPQPPPRALSRIRFLSLLLLQCDSARFLSVLMSFSSPLYPSIPAGALCASRLHEGALLALSSLPGPPGAPRAATR